MKTLFALLMLGFAFTASADVCTSVIVDRMGQEWQTFTRSSYSKQAACDQAVFDCQGQLSYERSMGRHYDSSCLIKADGSYPPPYPPTPYPPRNGLVCQTDLVDYYGRTVRAFTAPGASQWEACATSDRFCKEELARQSSYGYSCVNRGLIDNRNDPRPPRQRTESCSVDRRDPAGMFIQSYFATATGPQNADVRGVACRQAMNDCSRDLRGRQTCNISR